MLLVWNKRCEINSFLYLSLTGCPITPPTLPSSKISCYVGSTCTSVSCCLQDDITTLSYQLSLDIDACAEKMTIQLEKMSYTVSLFDYQMGTKGTAKLFGVLVIESVFNKQYIISFHWILYGFFLHEDLCIWLILVHVCLQDKIHVFIFCLYVLCRYVIDDLAQINHFVVDLTVKLCYSSGSSCEHDVVVLQGFKLPKPLCNFAGGRFAIQGRIKALDLKTSTTKILIAFM